MAEADQGSGVERLPAAWVTPAAAGSFDSALRASLRMTASEFALRASLRMTEEAARAGWAGPDAGPEAGVRPAKRSSCWPERKRSCIQRKR